jgi:hypothetical protein
VSNDDLGLNDLSPNILDDWERWASGTHPDSSPDFVQTADHRKIIALVRAVRQLRAPAPAIEPQEGVEVVFERLVETLCQPNLSKEDFETACRAALNQGFYDAKTAGWAAGLGEAHRVITRGVVLGAAQGRDPRGCTIPALKLLEVLDGLAKKGPFKWFVQGEGEKEGAKA